MSSTITSNVDAALRTQLDYYGQGRYDLAEEVVTADYIDHEAPPGTPPGPVGANKAMRCEPQANTGRGPIWGPT